MSVCVYVCVYAHILRKRELELCLNVSYLQVGAIRVDERGRQAHLLESCIFERRCSSGTMLKAQRSAGAMMPSIGGEEVFLHQLLQIARLLDTPFQASKPCAGTLSLNDGMGLYMT